MDIFFQILIEFGLPVASATIMGVFIYIILKYILAGVVGSVKGLHGIIMGLENRIDTMNNDLIHIEEDIQINNLDNIEEIVIELNTQYVNTNE